MNDTKDSQLATGSEGAPAKTDSLARLVLVLTLVTVIAAAALAGANALTKDRIAAARAQVKLAGIARVLPKCDNNPVEDAIELPGPKGKTTVYRCRQKQPDGQTPVVAVAIERDSSTNKAAPYSGLIQVMVGIDARSGKIRTYKRKGADDVGVVILKHSETPGLGSKAEAHAFLKAYGGRDLQGADKTSDGKAWSVKKDNPALGFVDAISGATITSRAVTEIVHAAMTVFKTHREDILTRTKAPASQQEPPRRESTDGKSPPAGGKE
jgi:electron transport complex protein RnfG